VDFIYGIYASDFMAMTHELVGATIYHTKMECIGKSMNLK
jgi:hypothetical protein